MGKAARDPGELDPGTTRSKGAGIGRSTLLVCGANLCLRDDREGTPPRRFDMGEKKHTKETKKPKTKKKTKPENLPPHLKRATS